MSLKKKTLPNISSHSEDAGDDLLASARGGSKPSNNSSKTPGDQGDTEKGVDLVGIESHQKKRKRPFKETDLISAKGLFKLYSEMQTLPLSRKSGHEAADMKRVMEAYRTWGNQIFPPTPASVVLQKCRDWSGKGIIKNVLGVLREKEVIRAEDGPGESLTMDKYLEETKGAREAAEMEATRRKEKKSKGGEDTGEKADGEEGEGDGENEYEDEEALDFTERQRRGGDGVEVEEGTYAAATSWAQGGGSSQESTNLAFPGDDLDRLEQMLEKRTSGRVVLLEDSEEE